MEVGHRVHLANTMAINQYEGLKHTNDETDARFLAQLLRLGILAEGHIPPARDERGEGLVEEEAVIDETSNSAVLEFAEFDSPSHGSSGEREGVKGLDEGSLGELYEDEAAYVGACVTKRQLASLSAGIEEIEAYVQSHCRAQGDYELVTSVPGIGVILGQTILLETGSIHRFPQVGNYALYARCVNTQRLSNTKVKGRGNRKNGNRYLAMAFMEAAHYGAIWNPTLKRFYQRKCAKRPVMVAKRRWRTSWLGRCITC